MYQAEANGAFFLTDNPIDRYTIGDRTPGLIYGEDGSLEIVIPRSDPGGVQTANWLPAPASGPFLILLRAYMPDAAMTGQIYTPPAIAQS
ncbi:DUF1214 domain-containing protein [Novosphingobium terrae]|uniref:DUF1214 domain-containing protein n=1 Tax=Novosphingobium terrae TaxID=2726189 RepID=UPI00197CE314|nr:DUF1214 domain-containing protein [Novosphingobium terrae]